MFMLNNLIKPLVRDKPSPRILLLRLSPILFGLFVILPVAIFMRGEQPPTSAAGTTIAAPILAHDMIRPGQSGVGTLAPGERHGWTLDGAKGQRLAIALAADWDSHLALVMPDGIQQLTQDGYSAGNGRALIDGVTLPADGTYTVVVSSETGEGGDYRLELTEAPPAAPAIVTTVGDGDEPILITR